MAQALLYNIKVTSNWAQVMAKDTAATNSNTKSKVANTVADKAADGQRTQSTGVMSKVFRMLGLNTAATEKSTASKKKNWYIQRLLNKSTKTAGYNVGGLSLRIHESLVPAMAILYTSMLPVIAGLLAIGSAAIVAMGGIAGVAAIGLIGWSKKYKKSQESGGFAGGRQPMGGGSMEEPDFLAEVMSGFTGFMDNPKVQFAINWTEDLFKVTLPDAFNKFLDSVDMSAMESMLGIFIDWLPKAATGLAQWGSKIYNLIGAKSLKAINNVFKVIAAGLISVSEWVRLKGFGELEKLGRNIADFAGSLMQLGKEVLPLLNEALAAIYPNPIKPVIDKLTELFGAIGENENSVKVLKQMTQLFAALLVLRGIEASISGFVWLLSGLKYAIPLLSAIAVLILGPIAALTGLTVGAIAAIILAGTLFLLWVTTWDNWLGTAVKFALVNLGSLIINTFAWIVNRVIDIANKIPGVNMDNIGYMDYAQWDAGNLNRVSGTQLMQGEMLIKVQAETGTVVTELTDEMGKSYGANGLDMFTVPIGAT